MKKTVLTFGFIAGAILSAMMLLTLPFLEDIGFDKGAVIGYTTMVLAFLLVFFGIRSYRENVGKGKIGFGRGLAVGLMITLVASVCYVATWEVIYYNIFPDFVDKYAEHVIEAKRTAGASQVELDKTVADMKTFKEMYKNPAINVAFTFAEILPIGLIMTLVSAGILRRRGAILGVVAHAHTER